MRTIKSFFTGNCRLLKPSATALIHEEAVRRKIRFNFSVGQPNFDLSPEVKAAAFRILSGRTNQYLPNAGLPGLRSAIAESLEGRNEAGFTADNVFVSAGGAKQAIDMLLRVFLEPNDPVLMFFPYWVSYPEMVRQHSGFPVFFPVFDSVDLAALETTIKENKTRLIILNNPTNPTGFVWDTESLMGLGRIAIKYDCLVISDDVYDSFVYDAVPFTSLVRLFETESWRFITVNSFSKTFSMMGYRIGYVLAEKEVVDKLSAVQSQLSSAANTFGQMLAEEALRKFPHEVIDRRAELNARRRRVIQLFRERGIKFIDPKGAFYVFFKVPEGFSGNSFFEKLMEAGIAMVPGDESGAPGWARMCYAGHSADLFDEAFVLFDKVLGR